MRGNVLVMIPRPASRSALCSAAFRLSRPLTVTEEQYPKVRKLLQVKPIVDTVRRVRMALSDIGAGCDLHPPTAFQSLRLLHL